MVNVTNPKEGGDVGFVRLGGQWIPEEDHGFDPVLHDAGADLEIAPLRAGGEAFHPEVGPLVEQGAGGFGGEEGEPAEQRFVILGEEGEVELALVVGDEGDGFSVHGVQGGLVEGPPGC